MLYFWANDKKFIILGYFVLIEYDGLIFLMIETMQNTGSS